jgi:ABC-2 type transport system permease protein
MPGWLKALAHINPLTYEVDAMRAFMVAGGRSLYGIGLDFIVLVATTVALMGLASRLYPNLAR